ncbi:MAG: tetratricopeptide repeat protein [Polyangiaceae bacterium]|nr:tetratricopeptide repeat protein [Polyangiaceae bacterium]
MTHVGSRTRARLAAAALGAGCAMGLAGCGGAATQRGRGASPAAGARPAPARPTVTVARTIVTPDGATDVPSLVEAARALAERGDAAGAATAFDRAHRLDPRGPLAPEALHGAATAHEQAGDREASLARFERLAQRHPEHALGREAHLRALRLLCYLERWQRAGEVADAALERYRDLRPFESVVVLGAKALALIATGDDLAAERFVEKGRNVIEAHGYDAAGRIPHDLALVYFALGEIRRVRAERIVFDPRPPDFPAALEARAQLLLDAQSAYSDTMRAYEAHWSTMAGYRVGELYKKLHEDLMRVPVPATADTDARRQLFEGALRLRYSILLTKALGMIDHTLAMAKRTGERTTWIERCEQARREIQAGIDAEERALDALPYTRAELREALEEVGRRAAARSAR